MIAVVGALLLAAALAVRILFWRATPDAAWPYSALFKGDAPLWLEYAQALRSGRPFELGLPIHPPGMGYLLAWLWNGEPGGIAFLRLCWAVLGALGVGLVALAALRSFGVFVAAAVGLICCFSSGLLLLSSSLDSETPYLVMVFATLVLFEDVRARPPGAALAPWSALNGLACLFRVEHVLYFGLMLAWLAVLWSREAPGGAADRRARAGRAVALSLAFFLLPLLPWHVTAWRAIARFNTEEPARGAAEEVAVRAIERAVATLRWDTGAERRRDELPAFCRRTSAAFVAATVAWRGGQEVRDGDFRVLEEAFGYVPQAVSRFPSSPATARSTSPSPITRRRGEASTGGRSKSRRRSRAEPTATLPCWSRGCPRRACPSTTRRTFGFSTTATPSVGGGSGKTLRALWSWPGASCGSSGRAPLSGSPVTGCHWVSPASGAPST